MALMEDLKEGMNGLISILLGKRKKVTQEIKCVKCDVVIPQDRTTCPKCGKKVSEMYRILCPKCGVELPWNANICYKCGCDFGPKEEGRTSSTTYLCPICGYRANFYMLSCPACGTRFV